ncbi:hypothetical protein [Immundisolibacter cernigliae]|uniref:Uncharacterized protein n=1 Tax=Immundisolibacter cernigliae TaxID=1810504 RepID=A0A1B1YPZ7_9GAMM|nr:hypothetical protein [Immundisolibacter cernigliae]ANX02854.1 hypothetical protein PG2T_00680 [Immundisolibacter cernigliae]
MIVWRQLPQWFLRAWPVIALAPVAAAHAIALAHFDTNHVLVNKLVGMSLQVLGGILILYSLDQNLGIFRERSLVATLLQWLREFPLRRETRTFAFVGTGGASAGGTASVTARRNPTSLEERVAQLELALQEAQVSLRKELLAVESRFTLKLSEHGSHLTATRDQLSALSAKVAEVAVGGFKVQAFGVLLALYGAITSVFA